MLGVEKEESWLVKASQRTRYGVVKVGRVTGVQPGFAVPVSVLPAGPNTAHVVLDMAASALRPNPYPENEDDIAAIAKQISDHAEAIYQNWKSRGLAPTEILSCNNVAAAEKQFSSALSPRPKPTLDSNDNLERLVNRFVVEDKARLARKVTPTSSPVQFARQKFENRDKVDAVVRFHPKSATLGNRTRSGVVTMDADGLQTWPLKNRTASPAAEVQREEERLIQALKSGLVIEESAPTKPTGLVKRVVKSYQEKTQEQSKELLSKKVLRTTRRLEASRSNGVPGNPVRPFLTRGSVAERVLIFEKCPAELGLDKRKPQTHSKESVSSSQKAGPIAHTTLQRHAKATRSHLLPRFFFPHGKASSQAERLLIQEAIRNEFLSLPNQQATPERFSPVVKACGCPLYWKGPLFSACGGDKLGYVELNMVLDYWNEVWTKYHDSESRFLHILTKGSRPYLLPEDFMTLVQDVVDTHPGLSFLKEAVEFHSRYVHTVISRIYYSVNSSWSGRISLAELRKSNLLSVIASLETEEDINQVTQYFSYEHFYVIYCKFWELDRDHDLYIDNYDLARHSDHALSTRIIDRIFSGAVTRGKKVKPMRDVNKNQSKMSYTEFVWFILAEEDKSHPRAIEYWFRCMDLDGDGYLSMYELEYFYDEQLQRMEAIGIECLPFEDCLCQMLDMIRPTVPGKVSLSDLKRCKMTPVFFDTFFNLEKYLDHEQRDPFASQRDHDSEMSDWDRYAAEEYELLVAEEGANENQDPLLYNCGSEEDMLSPNLDEVLGMGAASYSKDKVWPGLAISSWTDEFSDSPDYADSDSSI